MKRLDIIIVILVLVISAASLGILKMSSQGNYGEKYSEVYLDGELIKTISIDNTANTEGFTVKTEHGFNVIRVENGMVRIIEADCPDKVCVKDGSISEPGEILVCLPHKIVVEIKGESKGEIDELSY